MWLIGAVSLQWDTRRLIQQLRALLCRVSALAVCRVMGLHGLDEDWAWPSLLDLDNRRGDRWKEDGKQTGCYYYICEGADKGVISTCKNIALTSGGHWIDAVDSQLSKSVRKQGIHSKHRCGDKGIYYPRESKIWFSSVLFWGLGASQRGQHLLNSLPSSSLLSCKARRAPFLRKHKSVFVYT